MTQVNSGVHYAEDLPGNQQLPKPTAANPLGLPAASPGTQADTWPTPVLIDLSVAHTIDDPFVIETPGDIVSVWDCTAGATARVAPNSVDQPQHLLKAEATIEGFRFSRLFIINTAQPAATMELEIGDSMLADVKPGP
jgi:hypothetical protein